MSSFRFISIVSFLSVSAATFVLSPALSFYGIHACPVLKARGFVSGCNSANRLVLALWIWNLVGVGICSGLFWIWAQKAKDTLEKSILVLPWIASAFQVFGLIWGANEMLVFVESIESLAGEKMKWTFAIFGTLLVALQYKALECTLTHWVKSKVVDQGSTPEKLAGFKRDWIIATFQRSVSVASLAAALFFTLRLTLAVISEYEAVTEDLIVSSASNYVKVAMGIFVWYFLLQFFEYFKEAPAIHAVHQHLSKLADSSSPVHSNTAASGVWSSILASLNRASELLVHKRSLLKGFTTYVSDTVADEILASGRAVKSGEIKTAVVMSADLRDFTSWSSKLKPQEVVEILNRYFEEMVGVLGKNRILVDKFIGDGILAYALPAEGELLNDVVSRAVHAASEMHRVLARVNEELLLKGGPELRLGNAVHLGEVIVGSIGSQDRMQFTIIGDTVNTCSRLEGLCKLTAHRLLVSKVAYQHLTSSEQTQLADLGEFQVRGLDSKIQVYGAIPEKSLDRLAVA